MADSFQTTDTFTENVKTCFRKYFVFGGRAPRAEFWYWILFNFICNVLAKGTDTLLQLGLHINFAPTYFLVSLILFIPGLSVSVRRFHDINMSGWCVAVFFVFTFLALFLLDGYPIQGLIILFTSLGIYTYLMCKKSDEGPNRYGVLDNWDENQQEER